MPPTSWSPGNTTVTGQNFPLARPARETDSSGPGDKQVPSASPESEGSEPQTGGSGLQPAPNPMYS